MSHTWSVLSQNVVRFVLKRGPFCAKRGPLCPLRGPFCPWSVLSMVRYVPNSFRMITNMLLLHGPTMMANGLNF